MILTQPGDGPPPSPPAARLDQRPVTWSRSGAPLAQPPRAQNSVAFARGAGTGARGPLYGVANVRNLLHRLGGRAGTGKRVHPYGLRHTFAVELEAAGTPVTVISKLLGHSSTAVTSRYLDHLTNAQAVAVLEGVSLPKLEG